MQRQQVVFVDSLKFDNDVQICILITNYFRSLFEQNMDFLDQRPLCISNVCMNNGICYKNTVYINIKVDMVLLIIIDCKDI
jgi:hypothetical protein